MRMIKNNVLDWLEETIAKSEQNLQDFESPPFYLQHNYIHGQAVGYLNALYDLREHLEIRQDNS